MTQHEWQPAETAPLGTYYEASKLMNGDGPSILVWTGADMQVAWHAWDEKWLDGSINTVFFNGDIRVEFTHWMDLPAPPKEEESNDGSTSTTSRNNSYAR